jgi:Tfp pilus assembly protein PilN
MYERSKLMDQFFYTLLKITMVVLLIRAILSIATGILVTRRMKKAQEYAAQLDKEMLAQKLKQQAEVRKMNLVKDDYCGKMIDKQKAYIIHTDDEQYHHFCSWDCRQKYIESLG